MHASAVSGVRLAVFYDGADRRALIPYSKGIGKSELGSEYPRAVILNGGHAEFRRGHRQNSKEWGAMETVKRATNI
jgi:hypothetical protein